jgi:transcriptional regulator with XRE-family HTH domain
MRDTSIGDKIRKLRTSQGLTQIDLAERLSVVNSTISNWENGRRMPSISDLKRLSSFFDVSLSYFELEALDDYEHIEKGKSDDYTQRVEFRPLGFKTPMGNSFLMGFSLILLIASSLIDHQIVYMLLIAGVIAALIPFLSYIMNVFKVHETNYTKAILPLSVNVKYVHEYELEKITTFRLFFMISGLLAVILDVLLVFMLVRWINGFPPGIVVGFAFFLLIKLMMDLVRYDSLTKNRLFEKEIDYHGSRSNLKFRAIIYTYILETIILFGLAAFAVIYQRSMLFGMPSFIPVLIASVNAMIGYQILVHYKTFIAAFKICTVDHFGRITELQSS